MNRIQTLEIPFPILDLASGCRQVSGNVLSKTDALAIAEAAMYMHFIPDVELVPLEKLIADKCTLPLNIVNEMKEYLLSETKKRLQALIGPMRPKCEYEFSYNTQFGGYTVREFVAFGEPDNDYAVATGWCPEKER